MPKRLVSETSLFVLMFIVSALWIVNSVTTWYFMADARAETRENRRVMFRVEENLNDMRVRMGLPPPATAATTNPNK